MNKKLHLLLVASCFFPTSLLPVAALAANPLSSTTTTRNESIQLAQDKSPAEIFMESCITGAISSGAAPHEAQPFCQCALEKIMVEYTPDEFVQLVNSSPGRIPPPLESIINACKP